MIFRFEKRGANNWWHYNGTTQILNFSNWEIVFDEVSQSVNLQQLNGANVPNVNVPIADVRVKNLSGSDETFTTVALLRERLVALGYNPLVVGGGGSQNLAEVLAIGGREIKYHDTTTGDYTLIPTDKNKIIVLLEDTEIDIIIPASGFSDGDSVIIQNPNGTNSVNLDTTLTTSTITDFSPLLPSYSVAITYYNNGTDIDAYGASYSTNGLAGGGGSQNLQQVTDEGNETTTPILVTDGVDRYVEIGSDGVQIVNGSSGIKINVDDITTPTIFNYDAVGIGGAMQVIELVSGTGNLNAVLGANYDVSGTITFIDPTPVTNKGYRVYVVSGTTTINSVAYTSGNLIYRYYNGSAWVSTLINSSGGDAIVVSSNTTASNDNSYNVVANATFTDPTPVEGKGYVVFVRNGTATIGGVGYAVGRIIYRVFHSGAWSSTVYVDKDYVDTKVDENVAITGATKTKITYDAKGLVTAGADATTADINDSTNRRYVTDAQSTVIGNTSGTNTGDNATNTTSNAYADGKVADAINNGTTTIAPSQNAVFDALALKSDLNSPTFTGTPSAPTPTANDNSTKIATTAYVNNSVVVTKVLNADVTTTSTTAVDTNLSHPIASNERLKFSCPLSVTTASGGVKLQITVPTGAVVVGGAVVAQGGSTSIRALNLTANTLSVAVSTIALTSPMNLEFTVKNSTTAGNVIVSFASGTGGSTSILENSTMQIFKTQSV